MRNTRLHFTGDQRGFALVTTILLLLVLGVMIALVLAYEASALVQARSAGLTREVYRLVALFSAGVLLLVLLGISQAKWGLYLGQLEATYSESLLPDGG